MKLVETLLCDWQRWTCSHHWVRARWSDGSYGLRCSQCMKAYRHTWDEIIAGPAKPVQAEPEFTALRRAA